MSSLPINRLSLVLNSPSTAMTLDNKFLQIPTVVFRGVTPTAPTNSRSILIAPLCILFALSHSFSFHMGLLGVAKKISFSSSHLCFKNFSAISGNQCVSLESRPDKSTWRRSSIEACTAVPRLAAIPAFLGNLCRLNQYIRGQVSYLFHADGESVCTLSSPMNRLGCFDFKLLGVALSNLGGEIIHKEVCP